MPPRRGIGGLTCCGFLIRMRQTNSPEVAPGKCESPPLLLDAEVVHRMALLAELRSALSAKCVDSVLVRNRRLVLRYNNPFAPSGPTNPTLHILSPDHMGIVTTDGSTYSLPSGQKYSVSDPATAALTIIELQGTRRAV